MGVWGVVWVHVRIFAHIRVQGIAVESVLRDVIHHAHLLVSQHVPATVHLDVKTLAVIIAQKVVETNVVPLVQEDVKALVHTHVKVLAKVIVHKDVQADVAVLVATTAQIDAQVNVLAVVSDARMTVAVLVKILVVDHLAN